MSLALLRRPACRISKTTQSALITLSVAGLLFWSSPPAHAREQEKTSTPPATEKSNASTSLTADDYINKASAYSRLGDYSKAVAILTTALEHQPDASQLLFHRGNAYIQIAAAEDRIIRCTREIAGSPTPSLFLHRAFAYYNTGNYMQAISDYTQAITRRPDYAAAYLGRGLAFFATGKPKEGMADYLRAIQLRPDLSAAHRRMLFQVGYSPQ